jgi:O-antigen ligase
MASSVITSRCPVSPTTFAGRAGVSAVPAGISLGFIVFLVVNATLFVRPAEVIPELIGWPIYLVLILACLAVSLPQVLRQLTTRSLKANPITVFVLALLPVVVLSCLANLAFEGAAEWGSEFFKVVVYYLLFVGLVTSPRRIRLFLLCFTAFALVLTVVAVLQFRGVITLPTLQAVNSFVFDAATGREVAISRMRGTGIFNDPNDLCVILVAGTVLSVHWLSERQFGLLRWLWLGPLGLFGYALSLTHSRGGFLAMLVGLLVYIRYRFGWIKTLLLSALLLPVLFALFAGRQTELMVSQGTGLGRIQLWSDGMQAFRQNPLVGIGVDNYKKEAGHVAHNSFLHAFTEMGVLGGMLFLGAFYVALVSLHRLSSRGRRIAQPEMRRLQPLVMALVAGYATGMLALSLCYIVPTYTMLGLGTVFLQAAHTELPFVPMRWGLALLKRVAVASVLFLAATYLFIRVFLHW